MSSVQIFMSNLKVDSLLNTNFNLTLVPLKVIDFEIKVGAATNGKKRLKSS